MSGVASWAPRSRRARPGQLALPWGVEVPRRAPVRLVVVQPADRLRFPGVPECQHVGPPGDARRCLAYRCRYSLIGDYLRSPTEVDPTDRGLARWMRAISPDVYWGAGREVAYLDAWPEEERAELLEALARGTLPTCALSVARGGEHTYDEIGAVLDRHRESMREYTERAWSSIREELARLVED